MHDLHYCDGAPKHGTNRQAIIVSHRKARRSLATLRILLPALAVSCTCITASLVATDGIAKHDIPPVAPPQLQPGLNGTPTSTMPLVRESSLRAPRTWTKWSNGSKSTVSTSKNNAPSEIIHLGGSRVGTPESADPVDRPVTQWFALPPPPQPPVELPAPTAMSRITSVPDQMLSPASTTTSSLLSPAPLNLAQRDRVPAPLEPTPPSSSYPSPMLTGESASSSRSRDSPRLTGSSTSSRRPSTDAGSPTRTSHPLSIDMFSSSAVSSHPRSIDMLSPSTMSHTQSFEMVSPTVPSHPRSVDMFSPSTSSRFRNLDKVPPATATTPAIPESGHSLRRTQSAANIQERSRSDRRARTKWKALPAHPSNSDGEMDAPVSHVAQLVHPEAGIKNVFPPPANPPPKGPLPAINPTPVNDGSRQRRGSAPEQVPEPKPLLSGRFTPQERLWLHRNYRGEANFLKSWGLRIESDADRSEGADLLRELMQSETEMKASKQHQKKGRKMEEHELHISTEEPEGLHIILEEERSPQNATFEVRGAHDGTGVNLRVPVWTNPGSSGSETRMSPTRAEHKKSESEHSVLGAYLDVRMSRLD